MKLLTARSMRNITKTLITAFVAVLLVSVNSSPAQAFAGTLENGNMAYAQSSFNTGEACNYLPGFENGYDAWHFVLTTRGATFQQDPRNPAVAINLNFVFMRQDGSLFVIKSGAWVQTGKGAYTYTPVADRIRMVQAGTLAQINGSDSGMRLSHTCPGTGSITPTTTPTPSSSNSPTTSPTPTVSPTPSNSSTPSASASPTSSVTPSPSVSPTPTPTATPRPTSTVTPTLAPRPSVRASAIQIRPTSRPNALPTPTPTPQGIQSSPTPSPSSTRTSSPSPTPTNSAQPTQSATPAPTSSSSPASTPSELIPPVLPTPPPVEEPKNLVFVEPKTPTVIPPQTLPEPPASPIVITKAPEYGDLKITPTGEITYTSNLSNPKSTTVDVIEFTYTSLSGAVVVVRKEFLLTQRGDIPSIIQTGYANTPGNNYLIPFALAIVLGAFIFRKRVRHDEE